MMTLPLSSLHCQDRINDIANTELNHLCMLAARETDNRNKRYDWVLRSMVRLHAEKVITREVLKKMYELAQETYYGTETEEDDGD